MDKLIIVDMQNDFIDGALANPAAKAIVPGICKLIDNFKGNIICTMDAHDEDDCYSIEDKTLPKHCVYVGGREIDSDIIDKLLNNWGFKSIAKNTFAVSNWGAYFDISSTETIYIVGTCTEICVISNALALRSLFPNNRIVVYSNLCAGLTPESHEAALTVMKNCLIEVKEYDS